MSDHTRHTGDEQTPDDPAWYSVIDPERRRVDFEILLGLEADVGGGEGSVEIKPDFRGPIEIHFGRTAETSPCYLIHGRECPQLGADYVLIQPDVIAKDPRRGWVPLGGAHESLQGVGTETSPQLRLGPDVARDHATLTYIPRTHPTLPEFVRLYAADEDVYARIIMDPEDIRSMHADSDDLP